MKVIFSRKGFDSQNGGIPNAVLPNGEMLSFPIPDKSSGILYREIRASAGNYKNVYQILSDLGCPKIKENYTAHLDPDLCSNSFPRVKGWLPVFGQQAQSLSHLKNNSVGKGDLFLFFGLFRETEYVSGKLKYRKGSKTFHAIFGYLLVGRVVDLHEQLPDDLNWLKYHPHMKSKGENNRIFISAEKMPVSGRSYRGSGVFKNYSEDIRLSSNLKSTSSWRLPLWFYPYADDRPPLTYHADKAKWELFTDHAELTSVCRGQEFVLDAEYYPEIFPWIDSILKKHTDAIN